MTITIELPTDARNHVLECQTRTKIEKGIGHYSQEKTIIAIILQHKKLMDENPQLKDQLGDKQNGH